MRILLLCGATFLVGLLAGTLLFPDSGGARTRMTDRTRETGQPRSFRSREIEHYRDEGPGDRAAAPKKTGRNADVRTLSREAARKIAQIKSSARVEAFLAGDGTISGTVRDPAGMAVKDVTVTALPDAQPSHISLARRWARQRPHQDRDLARVAGEAIASELWRRDTRRSATTDQNGKFSITGLTKTNHSLTAFHQSYEVKPLTQRGKLQPDAVVDFLAKPIHETQVEVKLPDGTLTEYARLTWQGPEGKGADMWTRERGTARLPLGNLKIQARIWLPEPMESEETEHLIVAGSEESLVLQLKQRRVLTASLEMPEGFAVPASVLYRLRLLDGTEDVEPEALLSNPSQVNAYTPTPGRAYFFDLEPGRYLVAAFLDKRRLLASATIDVGEGSEEIALPMEAPDSGSYVAVRLVGPDGGPIPGRVSFRVITQVKNRPRAARADALQAGDAWLVFIDKIESKDSSEANLRVGTRDYGGAVEPISLRGRQTITIRFGAPAKVSVVLDQYKGSGVEGALFVALRGEIGADAWQKVGPDGSCDLRGVQPGPYSLNLYVRRKGKNWSIYQRRLNLRAGEDKLKVTVPVLHNLTVRWAGKGRPRNVILRCNDETIGKMRRDGRLAGRVTTFRELAPGTYTVECARKRATIRVPTTPEVALK